MKFLFALALLVAVAAAAPASQNPDADAVIVNQKTDILPEGSYTYNSETSNGIQTQEEGQLKPNPAPKSADAAAQVIAVQGQFSYTGPDGVVYTVRYVADENGFQPQAAHLPVAPVP